VVSTFTAEGGMSISGAVHDGVPQRVRVPLSALAVANPKSPTLTWPSESTSRLDDLMSLWIIPTECRCAMPSAASRRNVSRLGQLRTM